MPFPSGIRTTTGAPSSIVTTCTNARPRCAEGSGCWRFADPGKTSTGAQVRARLTSRARAASGRSPESGVAMVESSLPTFVIRRAGSNRPKLTRRAGEYRPRRRGTLMSACACARWLARADEVRVASRPRLEGGTTPGADSVRIPLDRHRRSTLVRDCTAGRRARVSGRASIGSASCASRNRIGVTDVDHRPGAVARRLVRPRRGVNRATSVVRITTRPSPTPGRRTGRGTRGSPAT